MIGTLGAKVGISTAQISRTNDIKRSSGIESANEKKNDKVSQIAKSIADGTYKVDLSKTAKAIADTLM
ncbi:MAG: flagellar biosynthesis anti-sigma factor FlgM [Campylobacter sp.]